MRAPHVWLAALAISCGGPSEPDGPPPPPRPDPLAPLPAPVPASSERFASSQRCAQCHLALDEDPQALRDDAGRDVSPVKLWRSSMMAMAARDPFFLAAWNEERSRHPDLVAEIDATCSRCHAPMGAVATDDGLTFEDLVAGDSAAARLARDGVSCALCHQILPNNLGSETSLSGGFLIGTGREIFGPHANPDPQPMQFFVDYTPVESDHILDAELCATCHTVVVEPVDAAGRPRGFELTEQATYFEWLNSSYADSQSQLASGCAACHLPVTDSDGAEIDAPIATTPDTLLPRQPFGRHLFVGGGAYMTRLLQANRDWAGVTLDGAELAATAAASESHLSTAAEIEIAGASRAGGVATIAIRVNNRTGHKLPTGYPSRRLWLHLTARDSAGQVVFESGAVDGSGALPGDGDQVREHLDRIDDPTEVAVWEAVLVDDRGRPTHRPLGAVAYGKDSRILPIGFSPIHRDIDRMRPVGTESDDSFVAGSDTVTFEIATSGPLEVDVELLYQSLPPAVAAAHEAWPTPAGVAFAEMVVAAPPIPIPITTATIGVP